jgi:membrane protein implicated in regulation of membrane protease activity
MVWLAAAGSLVLPVVGVAMALFGVFLAARGDASGWYWLFGGVALIVADVFIDALWARPRMARSDEPGLNRRGAEFVGQVVTVVEAIEPGGRGAVRAGDSVWVAEGTKAAAGARVKVTGVKGTVLTVAPIVS